MFLRRQIIPTEHTGAAPSYYSFPTRCLRRNGIYTTVHTGRSEAHTGLAAGTETRTQHPSDFLAPYGAKTRQVTGTSCHAAKGMFCGQVRVYKCFPRKIKYRLYVQIIVMTMLPIEKVLEHVVGTRRRRRRRRHNSIRSTFRAHRSYWPSIVLTSSISL
jgi:hypothetical protein